MHFSIQRPWFKHGPELGFRIGRRHIHPILRAVGCPMPLTPSVPNSAWLPVLCLPIPAIMNEVITPTPDWLSSQWTHSPTLDQTCNFCACQDTACTRVTIWESGNPIKLETLNMMILILALNKNCGKSYIVITNAWIILERLAPNKRDVTSWVSPRFQGHVRLFENLEAKKRISHQAGEILLNWIQPDSTVASYLGISSE